MTNLQPLSKAERIERLKILDQLLESYDYCYCDDDPDPTLDSRDRCKHCETISEKRALATIDELERAFSAEFTAQSLHNGANIERLESRQKKLVEALKKVLSPCKRCKSKGTVSVRNGRTVYITDSDDEIADCYDTVDCPECIVPIRAALREIGEGDLG